MEFSFSERELAFAVEARDWLEGNLPAAWRKDHLWARSEDPLWAQIAREWQARLHQGGWAAISWPVADGGRGATVIERWLFEEQLDRVGAPRPIASSGAVDLIGSALLRHGTESQRRRFLEPLLSGGDLWCQGFSEPGAGSDLASLRTRAERRGDTFLVNGQKVWTSHGDLADWCFLLCRTEPDRPKHKGISLLLVDMRSPGVTVRPLEQITGESEFCEVFFDNVEVPAAHLVGEPGMGWQIAMGILAHERGPVWTFTFQRKIRRSFERVVQLARQGSPTAAVHDENVRQKLAQSFIEVEILKYIGYRSLTRLLRTGHPGVESSLEKIAGSETDNRLQDVAMQVLGSYGNLYYDDLAADGADVARDYLYAKSETIMGGTSEIQRNLIAQRILGLPRD